MDVLQDPIWERSGHTDRGRDGCRVPIPWSGQAEPFGFSSDDATSMLELYRTALRLRRDHPALGDGAMTWLDASEGVLAFHREPGFTCVVNLAAEAYQLPENTAILLASGPVADGRLEPEQAVWLKA